jgi:predicted MPP superfamily phosphohydrolase
MIPRNKHVIINHHNQSFILACADHRLMKEYDIDGVMKNIPSNLPTILLTHIPDVILDEPSTKADLIICGHTHGGQIRLPFIGPLHPIPDELGKAYDQGIFTLKNGSLLAITHGIGETMARARLFCPPEIMVLHIQS